MPCAKVDMMNFFLLNTWPRTAITQGRVYITMKYMRLSRVK